MQIRRLLRKLFVASCGYKAGDCDRGGYLVLETREHGFRSPRLCLQHGWELYEEEEHEMLGQDPADVRKYVQDEGDTR